MKVYCLGFLFLFFYSVSLAQKIPTLDLRVSVAWENKEPGILSVTQNSPGKAAKKIKTTPEGNFSLLLEVNSTTIFTFSAQGFLTREISVNTKAPIEAIQEGIETIYLDVYLFKSDNNSSVNKEVIQWSEKNYRFEFLNPAMNSLKAQKQEIAQIRSGENDLLAKSQEEARLNAEKEAEAKRIAEAQAKKQQEEEARKRADQQAEEARLNAEKEAEAKRIAEAQAKKQQEEEARKRAEQQAEEARLNAEKEAEAKRIADAEAKKQQEEENKKLAEEAKRKAEEEAEAKKIAELERQKEALRKLRELHQIKVFQNIEERAETLRRDERNALLNKTFVTLKKYQSTEIENPEFVGYINFGLGGQNIEISETEFQRYRKVFNK